MTQQDLFVDELKAARDRKTNSLTISHDTSREDIIQILRENTHGMNEHEKALVERCCQALLSALDTKLERKIMDVGKSTSINDINTIFWRT